VSNDTFSNYRNLYSYGLCTVFFVPVGTVGDRHVTVGASSIIVRRWKNLAGNF
jgi:hypothetical protein